jgi:hypothetical protein
MIWFALFVGLLFLFVRVAIVVKNIVHLLVEKLVIQQSKRLHAKNMHPRQKLEQITAIAIKYIGSMAVNVQP